MSEPAVQGGKFLTFYLGGEEYGLEILKVREIIGMMQITRVPRTPAAVRGVINLRGKVIPVIDLRTLFQIAAADEDRRTCVIIVQANQVEFGVVVDQVSEVADVVASEIGEPPSFGESVDTQYLLGMARSQGRVKLLLNIDRVLSQDELAQLAGIGAEA